MGNHEKYRIKSRYGNNVILALQKAAATPSEQTKQNLYKAIESLYRIYYEFIGAYYGTRTVDMATPENIKEAYRFAAMANPAMSEVPDTIAAQFDFGYYRENPMMLKLDVGASSYYSEIASMQTLDGLLMQGKINITQYLERIPDDYIPRRRALIEEIKAEMAQQQAMAMGQMMPQMPQPQLPEAEAATPPEAETVTAQAKTQDVPSGRGYSKLQREINRTGSTEGLI